MKEREFRFTHANEAFADLIGKTDADFLPPHQSPAIRRDDRRILLGRVVGVCGVSHEIAERQPVHREAGRDEAGSPVHP